MAVSGSDGLRWCKHYNSSWHNTHCEAGVCYDDVIPRPNEKRGKAFRKPCKIYEAEGLASLQPQQLEQYQQRGSCDQYEEYTLKELQEQDKAMRKATFGFVAVAPVIEAIKHKYNGSDWSGIVLCPVCKGELHVRHHAYNGHVRAKCATTCCVAFME